MPDAVAWGVCDLLGVIRLDARFNCVGDVEVLGRPLLMQTYRSLQAMLLVGASCSDRSPAYQQLSVCN